MIRVRPVRADEWKDLRDVRLRALADAPMAFGSTLAETIVLPDPFWRDWADGEHRGPAFVADDGSSVFLGLVGARPDDESPVIPATSVSKKMPPLADVLLTSMWVDPACRRRGIAHDLIAAVVSWSRTRGAPGVRLMVTETNHEARRLYEACGFSLTGVTEPLPHAPDLIEVEMLLVLVPALPRHAPAG